MQGLTIYDYFQRACRKPDAGAPAGPVNVIRADDGNCAGFQLELNEERIAGARYKCTTCVTLVALCEHLSELVVGMRADEAAEIRPELLLRLHPEMPEAKRDRAGLAVRALRAALGASVGKGL